MLIVLELDAQAQRHTVDEIEIRSYRCDVMDSGVGQRCLAELVDILFSDGAGRTGQLYSIINNCPTPFV